MDYKNLPIAARCEPSAVMVEEGKTYAWCTCGLSEKQPFCDGAHKQCWTTDENGEPVKHFVSMKYVAEKTEEVWLCNCKHTKNPPFCDGSHKQLPAIKVEIAQ
jgi:CDGSH-type Zn-finger protein